MNPSTDPDAFLSPSGPVTPENVARVVADDLRRKVKQTIPLLGLLGTGAWWVFTEFQDLRDDVQRAVMRAEMREKAFETKLADYGELAGRLNAATADAQAAAQKAQKASEQVLKAQALLTQAETLHKDTGALKSEVTHMKAELDRYQKFQAMNLDVDKMVSSLKDDKNFQERLTAGLDQKLVQMQAGMAALEKGLKETLDKSLEPLQQQLAGISTQPGVLAIPYRAMQNGSDDCADIHSAMTEKRERGKVFFDKSGLVQFWRLSSSVSHNGETPRCHARFQGWLPERAFARAGTALLSNVNPATQLELPAGVSAADGCLRDKPEGRKMAEFSTGTVFFATGQRQNGWLEVVFDGWVPLEIRPSGRKLVEPVRG